MRGVSPIRSSFLTCAVALAATFAPSLAMADEPAMAAASTDAAANPSTLGKPAAKHADAKAQPDAATAAEAGAKKEPRDYYARRAKKILENAASAKDSEPHPLSQGYPEDFVTVCEAGCRGRMVEVVSREPRKPVHVIESGRLVTASAEGGDVADSSANVLVCLGGCRRGSEVIALTPQANWDGGVSAKTLSEEDIKTLKTTIGPESGRWMGDGASKEPSTN